MKRYFKDIDTNKKIDIILNNNDLREQLEPRFYEDNMEQQEEETELLFGKDWCKWLDIRDNYTSFYLVLKDWYKFINNLDRDYLCTKGIDLYNKIIVLKKEYENTDMVEDEDKFNDLEEKLEEYCKELLKICEEQLHEYENFNEDDFKYYLEFHLEENNLFDDCYIIDDDYTKVYQDITKVYE